MKSTHFHNLLAPSWAICLVELVVLRVAVVMWEVMAVVEVVVEVIMTLMTVVVVMGMVWCC